MLIVHASSLSEDFSMRPLLNRSEARKVLTFVRGLAAHFGLTFGKTKSRSNNAKPLLDGHLPSSAKTRARRERFHGIGGQPPYSSR